MKNLLILVALLISLLSVGQDYKTILVTNVNESGEGSFAAALDSAKVLEGSPETPLIVIQNDVNGSVKLYESFRSDQNIRIVGHNDFSVSGDNPNVTFTIANATEVFLDGFSANIPISFSRLGGLHLFGNRLYGVTSIADCDTVNMQRNETDRIRIDGAMKILMDDCIARDDTAVIISNFDGSEIRIQHSYIGLNRDYRTTASNAGCGITIRNSNYEELAVVDNKFAHFTFINPNDVNEFDGDAVYVHNCTGNALFALNEFAFAGKDAEGVPQRSFSLGAIVHLHHVSGELIRIVGNKNLLPFNKASIILKSVLSDSVLIAGNQIGVGENTVSFANGIELLNTDHVTIIENLFARMDNDDNPFIYLPNAVISINESSFNTIHSNQIGFSKTENNSFVPQTISTPVVRMDENSHHNIIQDNHIGNTNDLTIEDYGTNNHINPNYVACLDTAYTNTTNEAAELVVYVEDTTVQELQMTFSTAFDNQYAYIYTQGPCDTASLTEIRSVFLDSVLVDNGQLSYFLPQTRNSTSKVGDAYADGYYVVLQDETGNHRLSLYQDEFTHVISTADALKREGGIQVYPVPALGKTVQFRSEKHAGTLSFFNAQGVVLKSHRVEQKVEYSYSHEGASFYHFVTDSGKVFSGKL